MERFVFVAAIVIAVIFGLGAMFGHGRFISFDIDSDARGMEPVMQVAAGRMDAQTFSGQELRFRGVAAAVTITPEDRTDFAVEIDNPGRAPMPTVEVDDGDVVIDGHLRGRISDCNNGGASLRGYGDLTAEELPRITIRAPRSLNIDRAGAGTTQVGAAQSLNLDFSGCGAATLGDVAGELIVDFSGSGQIQGAAAQNLNADVAGSGELTMGAVSGGADIDLAGSGRVTIASLTGNLTSDAAGSGNVVIQGGTIGTANIDLAGSGDVDIAAPVQSLEVSIAGSGDVDVTAAVGAINAEIVGSGSVSAQSVSGTVSKEIWGSGSVNVGG